MKYQYLDKINSPSDLKSLSYEEIDCLCREARSFLVEKVGERGGHLASNLGVTELSVAIHRVFDSPTDHIIFDVGHQSYVHKIITGRKDRFDELRIPGGLSGFTSMRESKHDAFGAGHSSTSLSAALGYAEGDKLAGRDNYTVCVLGDGAYTGGMIHEAINNCKPDLKLIVIINENGMSISLNQGVFASYLSSVRSSSGYIGIKNKTDSILSHIPLIGKPLRAALSWVKNAIKRLVFKPSYFEDLGFYYLGPIDGNDYKKVERALLKARKLGKCVFVHLKTQKGKGLEEAERSPETFHSISTSVQSDSFHSIAVEELISLADEDSKVAAITAAMGVGTGLADFEKRHPDRYFDVGIAEEHALTFSAGLAANGYKPFTAIYSTFLQRGYDNIIHDIALQALPVKLLVDRAGISVADGATHHGIFDVSFLSHIPGMEIISPATYKALRAAVGYAKDCMHPIAIRYPNASATEDFDGRFTPIISGDQLSIKCSFDPKEVPKNIFVTYGKETERVLAAADELAASGIECGVILAERIKPYEPLVDYLSGIIHGRHVVYVEEGIKNGGAAATVLAMLAERGALSACRFEIAAIDDNFLIPDEICDIYDYAGLSASRLERYFL